MNGRQYDLLKLQIVAKDMIARGKGGSIVMVSSIASSRALNEHLLYCSTKGALDQMMRVFALELGKHQVNIFIKVASL